MQPTGSREAASRRTRVPCHLCGQSIDLVRMREHLRSEHGSASSEVENLYLTARIEARKRRRSQF